MRVYAEETENAEAKVYSNAALEDEFAEDRVLVVLNNASSLAVDQYDTATAFTGISCSDVRSLSGAKEAEIQGKISSISVELEQVAMLTNTMEAVTQENVLKIAAEDEELGSYHQVLCLELEESGKDKVLETIAELEQQDEVLYAGPDYVLTVCSKTPNDPYYTNGNQWAIDKIDLPEAWDITTGSLDVTVAVIDTGIYGNHPEMSGRIKVSQCLDFTSGYGLSTGMPTDDHGHGTFVAGIIGAGGNNGVGVVGTCWNVFLASLKVMDSEGNIATSHSIAAINYAESQGIPIINYSIGGYNNYDLAMYRAISNYSGLFVCSAGNLGADNDSVDHYPSDYDLPNIIAVGNSDVNDERNYLSNYGQTSVDIFAPGTDVYSTTSGGGYASSGGTSYAAPYVAGVAALLLNKYPDLSTAELKRTIMQNVDIVYDEDGESVFGELCVSGGRLNAYKALSNVVHSFTYTSLGVLAGHEAECSDCGYSYTESHSWLATPSGSRCSKCLAVNSNLVVKPESLNGDGAECCGE